MITFAVSEQREVTSSAEFIGDVSDPVGPNRALASGVLRQATVDLRRLRESKDGVGREMYWDTCSWFVSNDTEWPYSFANVCCSLGLSPGEVRDEVFASGHSGWVAHSGRVAFATATDLAGSLSSFFLSGRERALAVPKS